MIRTTPAQIAAMEKALKVKNALRNEQVWSFLVATLFESGDQARIIEQLCGEPLPTSGGLPIWWEAEPMPPRKASGGSEGNTALDLAFGHIVQRGVSASGIQYGPHERGSWVCFVEAKCLADCSIGVANDRTRNQLTRVIENLLCFQAERQHPERLFFTLLTPRLFKEHWPSRLYGYKIREYQENKSAIKRDIESCCIPARNEANHTYPDLDERLKALKIHWATFEDILEPLFGTELDIVKAPKRIKGVNERLLDAIQRHQVGAAAGAVIPSLP